MATATTPTHSITCSVADAAKALGVSEDLVRGFISRREIPASKLGKRIVIRWDDIHRHIDRNRI